MRGISLIYKLLSQDGGNTKKINMTSWEAELRQSFTLQERLQATIYLQIISLY